MFSSLYLVDTTIIRELHAVVTCSANIQRRLGQWTIPNNTYLWTTTLTQVSDVFMAAGSSYMKPIDFVLKLQTIPDFIHEPAAKAHLQMITLEAYENSLSLSSSTALIICDESNASPSGIYRCKSSRPGLR